jgi:phasin family protein
MKKFWVNARYYLAPLLIFASLFGVIAGGPWVWTGVALLGVGIIVDTITPVQTMGAGFDEDGETNGNPNLLNFTMYAMLGVFVLLQIAIAWRIFQYVTGVEFTGATSTFLGMTYYSGITGMQLVGAVVSTGIFAGIGIIYGHELAHTKGFSFVIARWMMALSGAAHFCYAHVYNHHLELGCEDDPAHKSIERGITMYAKMIEDIQANIKQAFDVKSYEVAMKPMNDLFEVNKATVEALAEQQTALVKELVEGAMEQAKALSSEKDMAAVVESQKSYLQGLQARLIDAVKASQETLVKSRDEATNIVKGAIETATKH